MLFISPKLHKYLLPVGFAIILILMIGTTLLTASRVDQTANKIITNQQETNNVKNILDRMSNANLERSHIIFKLAQSRSKRMIENYIAELYEESIRFNNARKIYITLIQSPYEFELLSKQAVLTIENIRSINEVIDHLENQNFEMASTLVNGIVLPHNKNILTLLNNLNHTANHRANSKLEETKNIYEYTNKSILTISLISIILSVLMMFYLFRKQRSNDNALSLLANTDILTELPNRSSFVSSIKNEIDTSKDSNSQFAVVFLDIDYFKSINDMYGHEVGDDILNKFSQTIQNNISEEDILSRFGGDEFVLMIRNKNQYEIRDVLRKLSQKLDTSFHIKEDEVFISASIGASIYPNDGENYKELLKNADIAMYTAKEAGRNCHQFYSVKDSAKQDEEHKISVALQTILKNKNRGQELSLVYQPLVNLDDEDFYDCEALLRWQDTEGNYLDTGKFIEIAEKSNLIQKVNMFVIEEVCKQQVLWRKFGVENIRVHINLSGNKRIFSNLFNCLRENIVRNNLKPSLFGIELTERTIYEVSDETTSDLEDFRKLGMKISIDDFGTGYSSLSYFKDLPITTVKIDRGFINGLPDSKIDVALVKTIITLAHSLDFDVVAEGVETQEQYDFLKDFNCNIAQGYLLHKPLHPADIFKLKHAA